MADTRAKNYQDVNAEAWDRWADAENPWTLPVSHETYERAKRGAWDVVLTPQKPVPHEWFPRMRGARVLGLASGGGQQTPIFAALGADCTVLDNSLRQLESERMVADREGYPLRTVRADMTKPLPFDDDTFDLIFHPVSNCYIRDVRHVWRECFRVLRPGGVLLSGVDNGFNYLFEDDEHEPLVVKFSLPFDPVDDPEKMAFLERVDGGVQFSHSLTEQIGGQLDAGLRLTALYEDTCDPKQCAVARYMPEFYAMRSIKPAD